MKLRRLKNRIKVQISRLIPRVNKLLDNPTKNEIAAFEEIKNLVEMKTFSKDLDANLYKYIQNQQKDKYLELLQSFNELYNENFKF